MRALSRFPLVFRTVLQRVADVDLLDDENLVFEVDLAFRI